MCIQESDRLKNCSRISVFIPIYGLKYKNYEVGKYSCLMELVTVPGALPEENKLLQPTTISIFWNKL